MSERDQPHVHDHSHEHDHEHTHEKDPAEQEALARDLAGELTDLFVQFVTGEIDFAEVSFATYDVLQDLHIISTGAYELVEGEEEESGDSDDSESDDSDSDDAEKAGGLATGYSAATATEEQEDLAQEPSRD